MDQKTEIEKIKNLTKEIRKDILTMSLAAGASSSHFGGSLSTVEILATLYNSILKFDSTNPLWEERDRFILSKGHACLGYYSVLSEKGYFPKESLKSFEQNGSFHTEKHFKHIDREGKENLEKFKFELKEF